MILADGLARRFDARVAVEDVSFEVPAGEIFGLLGPNGGGKTTTMRMLAGLLRPTAGRATIDGRDPQQDDDARAALGFLPEAPGHSDRLSARTNLLWFARLYGMKAADIGPRIDEVLGRLGLASRADDKVGGYSKGMRQRLALARALLHRPRALLLDEPTSGLDPHGAADVRALIAELAGQGLAIIVSTHNLAEAERLCRRVGIVKNRLLAIVDARQADAVTHVDVRAEGLTDAVVAEIAVIPGVSGAERVGDELRLAVQSGPSAVPAVVERLVASGARIHAVMPRRRPLEERYLELVGQELLQDEAGAVG